MAQRACVGYVTSTGTPLICTAPIGVIDTTAWSEVLRLVFYLRLLRHICPSRPTLMLNLKGYNVSWVSCFCQFYDLKKKTFLLWFMKRKLQLTVITLWVFLHFQSLKSDVCMRALEKISRNKCFYDNWNIYGSLKVFNRTDDGEEELQLQLELLYR